MQASDPIDVACLCAAWCRLCADYAAVFESVAGALRDQHRQLRLHWIDIEDEADLLGEFDVETFPTIVVVDPAGVRFAGPLAPQPETLRRLLRSTLEGAAPRSHGPDVDAFGARLRVRLPDVAPRGGSTGA
jgi:thioredoxin 1